MLTLDPAANQSYGVHEECIRVVPQKDRPSKMGWATVSLNFIVTEKVKQKEKTEEFVSNQRIHTQNPDKQLIQ